jgi:hypothetical protein
MEAFRTREGATVFVVDVASPMMMVPSGTTALTPGVWLSACASAAGIVAATALRSERVVIRVALTCFSWDTSGACMDAAVTSRACRWARFAGRFVSWSSNTTTMRSRLPDERDLTWLGLNLEKLGFATLARAVEPAAQAAPAPAITETPSAAAPSNEAALRGVKDILLSPFRPSLEFPGWNRAVVSGVAPVLMLHQSPLARHPYRALRAGGQFRRHRNAAAFPGCGLRNPAGSRPQPAPRCDRRGRRSWQSDGRGRIAMGRFWA